MSELNEQGSLGDSVVSEDMSDAQAASLSRSNWEERVAAARAEREKVLKAKGKSPGKRTVVRPDFFDDDPAARLRPVSALPAAGVAREPKNEPHPPERTPQAAETAFALNNVEEAEKPVLPQDAAGKTVSISSVVTVAFACFFGLGFGMVLSFGVVVAMGWISVKGVVPDAVATEATSRIPPEVHATTLDGFAPAVAGDAESRLHFASVTPVVSDRRDVPKLYAAVAAEPGLSAIQSPAPRLETIGVAAEPVSRFVFQPADISVSIDNPERLAVVPSLQYAVDKTSDILPVLPEKSSVKMLTVLASLKPPQADSSVSSIASAGDAAFVRMVTPALFEGSPGTMPKLQLALPNKLVVYGGEIQGFAAGAPEIEVLMQAAHADLPPQRALSTRAPIIEETARELPTIGEPWDPNPTLASKLGLRGDATKQFNLVTFAPTNVPDDEMATIAELLDTTGFEVVATNRVDFRVSRNHVRFYSPQDANVAKAIAAEIGGAARDFTTMRNAPPAGRVEIWLQGDRKTVRRAKPQKRSVSTAQRRAAAKAQLEQRLVNSLRRGDQFK